MRQLGLRKILLQCPTVFKEMVKIRILPRSSYSFKATSKCIPHWSPLILLSNPHI